MCLLLTLSEATSQILPRATPVPGPGLDTGDKGESDPDPHLE